MMPKLIIWFVLLIFGCQSKHKGDHITTQEATVKDTIREEHLEYVDTMKIDKNIILGHFDPEKRESFVLIPKKYADRTGMYMQQEAFVAFVDMYEAARKDGINLQIRSATRNFDYQKGIWERKWTGKTKLSDGTYASSIDLSRDRALKILEYSSMPGTSRHHWGTDIDLNAFNNAYFSQGEGLKVYEWLQANAQLYGYCQPYISKDSGRTGYNEEKWHWSYTPISIPYTRSINHEVHYDDIRGFQGSEAAEEIGVIEKYMLGISHTCR